MIFIENPAARLLEILEKGKAINPNQSCSNTWKSILNSEGLSDDFLLSRLAKVMKLPNEVYELLCLLEMSEKHKRANQYWMNQVSKGFLAQQLNSNWHSFIVYIDDHTIDYLAMTSEVLDIKSTIKPNASQELSEIKSTFQTLLDEILKNELLDTEVRRYLVRSLQRIIIAIDEHFISGYTPIIEAIETTIGYVALDSKTPEKKVATAFYETGMCEKFFTALNIISAMVTMATGIPQLSSHLMQSLLPLLKD